MILELVIALLGMSQEHHGSAVRIFGDNGVLTLVEQPHARRCTLRRLVYTLVEGGFAREESGVEVPQVAIALVEQRH